jgi:hypothetical protein
MTTDPWRWLTPALGDCSRAEVEQDIISGRAQLWVGLRSAIVTQLIATPEPHIHVWLGGGELRELVALAPGLESWARAFGCVSATIDGRHGWSRALRRSGWSKCGDILRKTL